MVGLRENIFGEWVQVEHKVGLSENENEGKDRKNQGRGLGSQIKAFFVDV